MSRALKRGGPPALRRRRRGSLLDPHRPVIDGLMAEEVRNAVVIWRGAAGPRLSRSVSIIRDYVRQDRR